MTQAANGLVPVHLGAHPPALYAERRAAATAAEAAGEPYHPSMLELPPVADLAMAVDWTALGLEPRWVTERADDCAAAIEPSIFSGRGADELHRFIAGAHRRGDQALVLATLRTSKGHGRSMFGPAGSIPLPGMQGSISGRELPPGGRPDIAPDLHPADRDLALRIRDNHPADGHWWALDLRAVHIASGRGFEQIAPQPPPPGTLHPLLVNSLGETVAAVWVSADAVQRWYALPDGHNWSHTLKWLSDKGLPAFAAARLRELRSPKLATDPSLLTRAEERATAELARIDREYNEARSAASASLEEARDVATPTRDAALYGTGSELVGAVATMLRDAGLTVVDLDAELGETVSADLLVSLGTQRRLVEVKSAGRAASEDLVGDLQRHLDTWPGVRPQLPVQGGCLVVNHDYRLDPGQRPDGPYRRRDFLATLKHPAIGTMQLFAWWCAEDWARIRTAVFATSVDPDGEKTSPTLGHRRPEHDPSRPERRRKLLRRWPGR